MTAATGASSPYPKELIDIHSQYTDFQKDVTSCLDQVSKDIDKRIATIQKRIEADKNYIKSEPSIYGKTRKAFLHKRRFQDAKDLKELRNEKKKFENLKKQAQAQTTLTISEWTKKTARSLCHQGHALGQREQGKELYQTGQSLQEMINNLNDKVNRAVKDLKLTYPQAKDTVENAKGWLARWKKQVPKEFQKTYKQFTTAIGNLSKSIEKNDTRINSQEAVLQCSEMYLTTLDRLQAKQNVEKEKFEQLRNARETISNLTSDFAETASQLIDPEKSKKFINDVIQKYMQKLYDLHTKTLSDPAASQTTFKEQSEALVAEARKKIQTHVDKQPIKGGKKQALAIIEKTREEINSKKLPVDEDVLKGIRRLSPLPDWFYQTDRSSLNWPNNQRNIRNFESETTTLANSLDLTKILGLSKEEIAMLPEHVNKYIRHQLIRAIHEHELIKSEAPKGLDHLASKLQKKSNITSTDLKRLNEKFDKRLKSDFNKFETIKTLVKQYTEIIDNKMFRLYSGKDDISKRKNSLIKNTLEKLFESLSETINGFSHYSWFSFSWSIDDTSKSDIESNSIRMNRAMKDLEEANNKLKLYLDIKERYQEHVGNLGGMKLTQAIIEKQNETNRLLHNVWVSLNPNREERAKYTYELIDYTKYLPGLLGTTGAIGSGETIGARATIAEMYQEKYAKQLEAYENFVSAIKDDSEELRVAKKNLESIQEVAADRFIGAFDYTPKKINERMDKLMASMDALANSQVEHAHEQFQSIKQSLESLDKEKLQAAIIEMHPEQSVKMISDKVQEWIKYLTKRQSSEKIEKGDYEMMRKAFVSIDNISELIDLAKSE